MVSQLSWRAAVQGQFPIQKHDRMYKFKIQLQLYSILQQNQNWIFYTLSRISLPIGTNGKPLAAIGQFPSSIGKLMVGKPLATDGEEIANAMIGSDVLAN